MKKILRYSLIFILSLQTANLIWQNLTFQGDIVLKIIKVAFILAIFEVLIKPVLRILLLPITFLTLGLIRLVISTLGFYLATFLIADFQVNDITATKLTWYNPSIPVFTFTGFLAILVTSFTTGFIFNLLKSIVTIKKK